MKRILILTDFSKNAWNAVAYAMAFYKDKPVTYILAHISPPGEAFPLEETFASYVTGKPLKSNIDVYDLDALKKKMLKHSHLKERQIEVAHWEANFADGIKRMAKQQDIDLIVMGTKGRSDSKNEVIGGHARTVITKIKYPVMIIPEEATFRVPLNIAFPTDYDFIYKEKVLNVLSEIVNVHRSNLNVLRVANSRLPLSPFQKKNRGCLNDFFKSPSVSFHRVNQPDLEYGIQSFIDSMNIDMVAMVAKNLNFFQKLLFNSRVIKMSYHLSVPFLVLHE